MRAWLNRPLAGWLVCLYVCLYICRFPPPSHHAPILFLHAHNTDRWQ